MGKSEENKKGFLASNWLTIILVVIMIVLAIVLIMILKNPKQFDMFKSPKELKKPEAVKPVMDKQYLNPESQLCLELFDPRIRLVTEKASCLCYS